MPAPAIVNRFPVTLQSLSAEEQGFHQFVVTNQDYVELPGCQEVHEVRYCGQTMPVAEEHRVPVDATHTRFNDIAIPNYALVEGPTGAPALVRSLNSNDGKWQVGQTLQVKGKWDDDAPEVGDGLDKMSAGDLRKVAKEEHGLEFPAVGVSKAAIIKAIREKIAE